MNVLYSLSRGWLAFFSPTIIVLFLSKTTDYASNFIKVIMSVLTFYVSGILMIGYSRKLSSDYVDFFRTFKSVSCINWLESSVEKIRAKSQLMKYDFDFDHFPVEFVSKSPVQLKHRGVPPERTSVLDKITVKMLDVIAYIAVQTFARRILYPGSVWILQTIMFPMLQKGRHRLVEQFHGERFKIQTCDHNYIDALLVDRRNDNTVKGRTLVICCEGNAGYYEVGVMSTPLDAGYSVLGWNHPGFAGSTGLPFRTQEVNAIDAVMKFALSRKFEEKNIIILGWSIGGFCASIAAMQYPSIAGVILDASFDDIVPLARSQMPSSWKCIVEHTIRSYFNLNVSENLAHYNGPILIIRRLQDEIIHTLDTDPLRTNRANDILIKLLSRRFPKLFDSEAESALRDCLCGSTGTELEREQRMQTSEERDRYYLNSLLTYIQENNVTSYPIEFDSPGERVNFILFLAEKHFKEHDSTHCMPLPSSYCVRPFDIFSLVNQETPLIDNPSPQVSDEDADVEFESEDEDDIQ